MKLEKIGFGETGNFSPIFLDYMLGNEGLKPFYSVAPKPENFKTLIEQRSFDAQRREILVATLHKQYQDVPNTSKIQEQIDALQQPNTFTITTGHQLNIFTGPLYFIYKIITAINTARKLKQQFPDFHFIPIYWMASEDHDFEEINHFRLFGKEHVWENAQKGAVGRMDPSSLKAVIEALPEKVPLFEEAYLQCKTLAEATRQIAHALFGKEGLVVLDADDHALKQLFAPVIEDDLLNHSANKMVEKTSKALADEGYKTQVYPREINFFYMDNGLRERIVEEEGIFKVLNTDLVFTRTEIVDLIKKEPEKFSPNVVLRPLYQEMVLPNLAYIGGPAEMAYWMQLKPAFDHYQVPFPMLLPRNFVLVINGNLAGKMEKLGLAAKDLFLPTEELKEKHIHENAGQPLDLDAERTGFSTLFEQVQNKAMSVDQSLEGFVGAEKSKVFKILEHIEKRIKKSEEQNQSVGIRQIENLKSRLFPNGNLQERTDNFLNFHLNNKGFLDELLDNLDPFDFRFNVLLDDD